jgi:hypothetical protein
MQFNAVAESNNHAHMVALRHLPTLRGEPEVVLILSPPVVVDKRLDSADACGEHSAVRMTPNRHAETVTPPRHPQRLFLTAALAGG